ncbi:LPS assembly lipoprotein LptE [Pseudodesulfovibrio sediminis]|uniref:Lipoprotein n=1 Tax=Pseudodesulfovibrio sediminis TaxID=2810563 RepID=A0ABN6ETJ7_9BACT|nr:LPS assembly lipoprotein LptE [Pseudodesulfovibrio sediminis]BCS89667.1 hypothetical protein PSDVSF_29090 [Pseudodesulfovibrio sediminis]
MPFYRYILLLAVFALAGCSGYSFGEGESSVLPKEYRVLAIGEVSNPTTISWLEPRLRKLLRDELNNRGSIQWSDTRATADAVIDINIHRYNRPTAVSGSSDETLSSVAVFQFEAVIISTMDDSELWRSGVIDQQWPFFSGDESQADKEVTKLGIRRLADRMTQNY